jgi:ribosome-associated toxin RatA of RatAB toxin-antitoxin module
MRTVRLRLFVPNQPASEVYAALADFGRYRELCDAVRSVAVTEVSENVTVSSWEVTFRAGLLRWTEQDTFAPGARSITFRQLEGDIAVFDGSWQCSARALYARFAAERAIERVAMSAAAALGGIARYLAGGPLTL